MGKRQAPYCGAGEAGRPHSSAGADQPAKRPTARSVNHSAGEYARGSVHCNTAEAIWSLLRPYLRTFRGVSKVYLPLYVAVFEFQYNDRHLTTWQQAGMLFQRLFQADGAVQLLSLLQHPFLLVHEGPQLVQRRASHCGCVRQPESPAPLPTLAERRQTHSTCISQPHHGGIGGWSL
ncbi:MAG: transposase [Anaerolineae bacterium]